MSTIPSWARKGAKVACISDNGYWQDLDDGSAPSTPPIKGSVYTVTEVEVIHGLCYLTLAECSADECYSIRNFRPVIEPKSEAEDVALFRHHLTHRVPERA